MDETPLMNDAGRLRSFTGWLRAQLSADDVRLVSASRPKGGASSETWLIDVVIVAAGRTRVAHWVVRVQAGNYQV